MIAIQVGLDHVTFKMKWTGYYGIRQSPLYSHIFWKRKQTCNSCRCTIGIYSIFCLIQLLSSIRHFLILLELHGARWWMYLAYITFTINIIKLYKILGLLPLDLWNFLMDSLIICNVQTTFYYSNILTWEFLTMWKRWDNDNFAFDLVLLP